MRARDNNGVPGRSNSTTNKQRWCWGRGFCNFRLYMYMYMYCTYS